MSNPNNIALSFCLTLASLAGNLWPAGINFIKPEIGQESKFVRINNLGGLNESVPQAWVETIERVSHESIEISAFQLDSNLDRLREVQPLSQVFFKRSKLALDSGTALWTADSLDFLIHLEGISNDRPYQFKLAGYEIGGIRYDTLLASYNRQSRVLGNISFMKSDGTFVGYYHFGYDERSIDGRGIYNQDYLYVQFAYFLSQDQASMDSIYFTSAPEFNFLGKDSSILEDSIFSESINVGNFIDYVGGSSYFLRVKAPRASTNSPPKTTIFIKARNTSFPHETLVGLTLVAGIDSQWVWEGKMHTQDFMCTFACLHISDGFNRITFGIDARMDGVDGKLLIAVQYFERRSVGIGSADPGRNERGKVPLLAGQSLRLPLEWNPSGKTSLHDSRGKSIPMVLRGRVIDLRGLKVGTYFLRYRAGDREAPFRFTLAHGS